MSLEFKPMRSLIYVDVVKEDCRHMLKHWLYKHHIPDSISQFGPYVTKYAFYPALPTPTEGDRFGTCRMQLTEHYWTINPMCEELKNKALTEYFPMDVLKWQGNIPDDNKVAVLEGEDVDNVEGDDARATGGNNGCPPFIFAFVPVCWEEDIKGAQRTVEDGPNYRWQFVMKYPEGVPMEEGDKWFYEEVIPKFKDMPDVLRILTSKIIQEVNGCPYQRVVEMWFNCPSAWYRSAVVNAKEIKKPSWAQYDEFPYLKPKFEISSLFLTDIAESDNFSQYRGYITMR
jgi:chalcone isomerase